MNEKRSNYSVVIELYDIDYDFGGDPMHWDWPTILCMLPENVNLIEAKILKTEEEDEN